MILEEAISFLKKNPPFHLLEEPALRDVARSLSMEFYPEDGVIRCAVPVEQTSCWIISYAYESMKTLSDMKKRCRDQGMKS